eukprot:UN05726
MELQRPNHHHHQQQHFTTTSSNSQKIATIPTIILPTSPTSNNSLNPTGIFVQFLYKQYLFISQFLEKRPTIGISLPKTTISNK